MVVLSKTTRQILAQNAGREVDLESLPRGIERSLAQGVFRALLRRAMRRTRCELLERFTKLKGRTLQAYVTSHCWRGERRR